MIQNHKRWFSLQSNPRPFNIYPFSIHSKHSNLVFHTCSFPNKFHTICHCKNIVEWQMQGSHHILVHLWTASIREDFPLWTWLYILKWIVNLTLFCTKFMTGAQLYCRLRLAFFLSSVSQLLRPSLQKSDNLLLLHYCIVSTFILIRILKIHINLQLFNYWTLQVETYWVLGTWVALSSYWCLEETLHSTPWLHLSLHSFWLESCQYVSICSSL